MILTSGGTDGYGRKDSVTVCTFMVLVTPESEKFCKID
jgi:hypothetical protein